MSGWVICKLMSMGLPRVFFLKGIEDDQKELNMLHLGQSNVYSFRRPDAQMTEK